MQRETLLWSLFLQSSHHSWNINYLSICHTQDGSLNWGVKKKNMLSGWSGMQKKWNPLLYFHTSFSLVFLLLFSVIYFFMICGIKGVPAIMYELCLGLWSGEIWIPSHLHALLVSNPIPPGVRDTGSRAGRRVLRSVWTSMQSHSKEGERL